MPSWLLDVLERFGFPVAVALFLLIGISPKLNALQLQNQKQYDILKQMTEQMKTLVTQLLAMLDRKLG